MAPHRALLLVVGVLAGCPSPSDPEPGPDAGAKLLGLRPASLTVGRKEVVTFVAEGAPAGLVWEASGGTLTSDGASATLTAPDDPGEITLTARTPGGVAATARVRVERAAPRIMVGPSALLFAPGAGKAPAQRALRAKLHDAAGARMAPEEIAVEWVSSDPASFTVEADPADPLGAIVTRKTERGAAIISARAKGRPLVISDPVIALAAAPAAGSVLVRDEDVVFPPADVPEGADLAALGLPDLDFTGGAFRAGGFTEAEIAPLYATGDDGAARLGVVLRGAAPAVGTVLVADGGANLAGKVIAAEARGGFALVQIEVGAITDVFRDLSFGIRAEELEQAGQLRAYDTATWELGEPAGAGVKPSALGGWRCEVSGSLALVSSPKAFDTYLGPIFDGDIDISDGTVNSFFIKVGLRAKAIANPEIRIHPGVKGLIECRPRGYKHVFPIGGPVALFIAPAIDAYPQVKFTATLTAGPTISKGAKVGFDASVWNGARYTAAGGWTLLCKSWEECHSRAIEKSIVQRWVTDPPKHEIITLDATAGMALVADLGLQGGGPLMAKLESWSGRLPIIGEAVGKLGAAAFVAFIQARVGPTAHAKWASLGWVLSHETTEAAANVWLAADLVLKLDLLNKLFQRALKLGGVREVVLANLLQVDLLPPYNMVTEETLTVNGERVHKGISDPVPLREGESVSINATIKRDTMWLSPLAILVEAIASPHVTWPHVAEVYLGEDVLTTMRVSGSTLAADFTVSRELCDAARAAPGKKLKLKIVATNKMWFAFETPNYIGDFELTCGVVSLEPSPLDLRAKVGETVTGSATLFNHGPPLSYQARATGAQLTLTSAAAGPLASNWGAPVAVSATCPDQPGAYAGSVELTYEDERGMAVVDGVPAELPIRLTCIDDSTTEEPCEGDCGGDVTFVGTDHYRCAAEPCWDGLRSLDEELRIEIDALKLAVDEDRSEEDASRLYVPVSGNVTIRGTRHSIDVSGTVCDKTLSIEAVPLPGMDVPGLGDGIYGMIDWRLPVTAPRRDGYYYGFLIVGIAEVPYTKTCTDVNGNSWTRTGTESGGTQVFYVAAPTNPWEPQYPLNHGDEAKGDERVTQQGNGHTVTTIHTWDLKIAE